MKRILIVLACILPLSCAPGGDFLRNNLSASEYNFAFTVLSDYSSYVYVQVQNENPDGYADVYNKYFEKAIPVAVAMGSADGFRPIDNFLLEEIKAYDSSTVAKFLEVTPNGGCKIKKDGKYMEVLKKLSRRGSIYRSLYKHIEESDGCTGLPALVALNYKKFHFDREADRFLFAFAIITSPEGGFVPFGNQ